MADFSVKTELKWLNFERVHIKIAIKLAEIDYNNSKTKLNEMADPIWLISAT